MAANTVFVQLFAKLIERKEEHCAKLRETFAVFDKDNNGFITYKDVGKVLRSLGKNPTDGELKEEIAVIDVAGTGTVDFDQYYNYMAPKMEDDASEEDLKEAFNMIDKDQDGFISAAELREVATALGEAMTDEEANAMVENADLDGDGMVSLEEFVNIVGK